ncbi:ankyrin repeat-containing protein BDA1-like [Olea europaea var. sylvestris]|uniref:ankyrin repeat-containing protein BDA1-like n=1 Tax=Olea europaea var. sylvestris TaxID=158386 RepID=UPI000C1CCE05|nr:ankyrin repeat-containing protein BDA1-like [Olea europaea var. sylvestris]
MNAIEDPDIVHLYTKIRNNPHYLEVPSEMPFVESPLHTAASQGRTSLALEILRLKPLLGKKLNLDGLSPLHLALSNGHTNTVRRLVKHNPVLIRVPGREGITLLHYAVEKEDIDLLIYFLLICPSSINDMTVRDETVVHIAVRNENLRAFKVLLGWAGRTLNTTVLPWRNEEGNTVMHLAALTNQSQVIKSLIRYVHVNEKNLEGKTALDILNPENVEARKILISAGAKKGSSLVDDATSCENYLKSTMTRKESLFLFGAYLDYGLSGNMRNAFLVVVVLIATAAFQAALTPPFWISHNGTTPVFPSITSVYNETTSTNSTSTNFGENTPLIAKTSVIMNTIAFSLAMGTCTILTNAPLR